MILAGIVLYNPEIERLKENVIHIKKQVDKIIFIDNNSKNLKEIKEIFKDIEIIENSQNLGIAHALNQILDYSYVNKYEWFLTLDQDSVCNDNLIQEYVEVIRQKKFENVAMYTCNIIDRNFTNDKKNNEVKKVERCITSGTLNNTNILKKIGGFDNKMFIDLVDFDICSTLIENGYDIIKINYDGLLHEVGHARKIKFLNKEFIIYNHSSFRVYYIIRNGIYYAKKHHIKKFYLLTIKRAILILIFQKNRIENLKQIFRGYKDSIKINKE